MLLIVILGLILVALMVYTSTRIKRSAAAAFEAEIIETEDFVIQKPEGFLNVVGPDPKYVFEAYSKDFGGPKETIRLARANLTIGPDATDIKDEIVSDIGLSVGEQHYRVVEAKRVENDVDCRVFHKLAEKDSKTYDLEMTVLAEASDDFLHKAEAMLASFELK